MKNEKYNVTGMTCSACSTHVEKSVSKIAGVKTCSVNLLTNSMQVEYDELETGEQQIIEAVVQAGYGASNREKTSERQGNYDKDRIMQNQTGSVLQRANEEQRAMKKRLILSLVFWIPLMYVSMGHMLYEAIGASAPKWEQNLLLGGQNAISFAMTQLILLVPIILINQKYFTGGFKSLRHGSPNMDSLIAIGAGAAILYGIFAIYKIGYGLGYGDMDVVMQYRHDLYFESAGTILTLITIGKYLESKSKGKTSEAITKLMNLTPKTVTVIRENEEQVIPAEQVIVGDIFMIKPGESVAVDGVIVEGSSAFDESAITGESMPVDKTVGSTVVSASINKSGLLKVRATKVGEDTTIAKIIRLVEDASATKAPIAKLADRIAGVFVPVVMTISLLAGIIWLVAGAGFEFAMSVAIAVLVISCPCALGLATPVAIMVGTGKGAENGILIKSGEALERAHLIDTVVLDKTGTITEGKPVATDVIVTAKMTENELLMIAGSLEKGSEHPLAEAIVSAAKKKEKQSEGLSMLEVEGFAAHFGKGIEGSISGKCYFAGNEKLMKEQQISWDDKTKERILTLSKQGKTVMFIADKEELLGIIAVADTVKQSSREAVLELKKNKIHVIMLTGDNKQTAEAIRSQVEIDEVVAEVLPQQKAEKVLALQRAGHKVAMVGDGVNDAPALAAADVGIAIGAGTDIAIESADIILVKNNLMDVSRAIRLSRAVIRNIKENLFWAFFYNCIGIPLAAGVLYPAFGLKLNPMFGAAAMSFSSLFVVGNALRLKRVKLREKEKTMKETIQIEGMMCVHCTGRVEKALKEISGVEEVTVSLENKNAVVTANENVTRDQLEAAVTNAGYEVVK